VMTATRPLRSKMFMVFPLGRFHFLYDARQMLLEMLLAKHGQAALKNQIWLRDNQSDLPRY
jgi:hypothetical protein